MRRTVADSGTPLGVINYDPWGTPESGTVPTFGFTGEVQDASAGLVNLRARWYSTARGRFTTVDPFAGMPEQPYSLHQYQYAYSDPVLVTDRSGLCGATGQGDDYCHEDHENALVLACFSQGGIWNPTNQTCQGGPGTQQRDRNDDTHECLGYLGAVEVRVPLAGGGTAPACLHAPLTQYDPTYFNPPRKPKQPTIIVDALGNLVCANDGSDSQDEEEPAQLGQSSFLPDLGMPTPPGWLKKLRRGLDGFLRPNVLRNPKTWQEAEDMIAEFTGVRPNRKPQTRIPVPGTIRKRVPDFVAPDWLGESKFLDDTPEFNLGIQQKDVAKIAKDKLHIPYYVFVTEGKPIDSKLVRRLRDTGGDIIIFFKQP